MNDQASDLREITLQREDFYGRAAAAHVVAVSSGKGGVGKTNLAVNLSISLANLGNRVCILDADFGLANIDVLLGLAPKEHLAHVLFGDARLDDIILEGPAGISIIPASSGMEKMTNLTPRDKDLLWAKLHGVMARMDWLIIDTAAGISPMVMDFLVRAEEVLLVCNVEPTSLVDAYALVKVLEMRSAGKPVRMVVNGVYTDAEGREVHGQLNQVTESFLHRTVDYLGWVAFDDNVPAAVRMQRAVTDWKPGCAASRSYVRLAKALAAQFAEKKAARG